MNKIFQALILFGLVALPGLAAGQTPSEQPIKISLCELAKNPAAYNGRMVQFRSEFVSKSPAPAFVDPNCSAKVFVGAPHVLDHMTPQQGEYAFTTASDDLQHPERLTWQPLAAPSPVQLQADDACRSFERFAAMKSRWADGALCADCPLYRITATATGRFEYFETRTVAVRAKPGAQPVLHAAGNAPLLRLALESVSGVDATPIHPSVYLAMKRRTINLEEASGLVFAYLKSLQCTEDLCALDPFQDAARPGFFAFEALRENPTGSPLLGSYEVDPRTGEVWNGAACGRFESPALGKLQRAIRKRIGLSEAEYKTTRTTGPLCKPGFTAPAAAW